MAKLSKFFKSLLGFKTTASPPSRSDPNKQPKRQWNLVESNREHPRRLRSTSRSSDGANSCERRRLRSSSGSLDGRDGSEDPSKHAIALAAATAAVVDAAVEADQAAAEVVRMTGGTTGYGGRRELAAVRIQSCFRAYLARKALRALKALVKLQALVRGHILRKQTVDMVRRLQALTRAQARVRVRQSDSTHLTNHGTPTPKKYEHVVGTKGTKNDHPTVAKRNGYISYTRGTTSQKKTFIDGLTNEENDKIVEIDHEKPYITVRKRNLFQTDHSQSQSLSTSRVSTTQPTSSSPCASCEVNSIEGSTRGGPPTPLKSNGSRSYVSEYFDKPNYMSYTMSSRAKVRSLSAPKPRPLNEHNGINKKLIYRQWSGMRSVSTMRDSFLSKGYQGSGRLDRLGMPVVGVSVEEIEFYGGYWN